MTVSIVNPGNWPGPTAYTTLHLELSWQQRLHLQVKSRDPAIVPQMLGHGMQMVERQTLPRGAILMEYCEPIEVIIVVSGSLDLIIPTTPTDAASSTAPFSPQQAR